MLRRAFNQLTRFFFQRTIFGLCAPIKLKSLVNLMLYGKGIVLQVHDIVVLNIIMTVYIRHKIQGLQMPSIYYLVCLYLL